MKTTALLVLALGCVSPAAAQDAAVVGQTEWRHAVMPLWHVDVGYPVRVSTGVTLVVSAERRLSGYETHLRGLVAGSEPGRLAHADASSWNFAMALHAPRPMPLAICGSSTMLCVRKIRTELSLGSACHQLP